MAKPKREIPSKSVELYENFEELKQKYLLVRMDKKVVEKENFTEVQPVCFKFSESPRRPVLSDDTRDLLKPLSVQRHLHTRLT